MLGADENKGEELSLAEESSRWSKTFHTPNVGGYEFDVNVHMHKERERKLRDREMGSKKNAADYLKKKQHIEKKLKLEDKQAGEVLKRNVDEAKGEVKKELDEGIAREKADDDSLNDS